MTQSEQNLIERAQEWHECKMALKKNKASSAPEEIKREKRKTLGFDYDNSIAALSLAVRMLRRERNQPE